MNGMWCRSSTPAMLIASGLVLAATSSIVVVAGPKGADMKVTAQPEVPSVIAVRTRHDLCPICRSLDTHFQTLIEKTGDSVLFVTLDLTSVATQKQAALLVSALGIDQVWTGDLSKVGSVMFLNGRSKATLSFVQSDDAKQLESALREAVNAAK